MHLDIKVELPFEAFRYFLVMPDFDDFSMLNCRQTADFIAKGVQEPPGISTRRISLNLNMFVKVKRNTSGMPLYPQDFIASSQQDFAKMQMAACFF